jgi:hypothetical protein
VPSKSPPTVCDADHPNREKVSDENFENEDLNGWVNARIETSAQAGFTKFLGLFTSKDLPTKTFAISPERSGSARVEFEFYEIDSWNGNGFWGPDNFLVVVNNQQVDLGFFTNFGRDPNASGTVQGISWSHNATIATTNLGFGIFADQKHDVVLDIPGSYLTGNALTLKFHFNVTDDEEYGGIDNLVIYSCS